MTMRWSQSERKKKDENHHRTFELQIKTLQDAPRDADKLRQILKVKQEGYEKHRTVKT